MRHNAIVVGVVLLVTAPLVVVRFETLHADDDATTLLKEAQALFKPLSRAVDAPARSTAAARVELGRMLFFDPRWTLRGNVSCATCHQPALYGTDALAKSMGVEHRMLPRPAPLVLKGGLNFARRGGGDRRALEDKAEKALGGVFSSGHPDPPAATARIKAIEGYSPMFRHAFPGEPTP